MYVMLPRNPDTCKLRFKSKGYNFPVFPIRLSTLVYPSRFFTLFILPL